MLLRLNPLRLFDMEVGTKARETERILERDSIRLLFKKIFFMPFKTFAKTGLCKARLRTWVQPALSAVLAP